MASIVEQRRELASAARAASTPLAPAEADSATIVAASEEPEPEQEPDLEAGGVSSMLPLGSTAFGKAPSCFSQTRLSSARLDFVQPDSVAPGKYNMKDV